MSLADTFADVATHASTPQDVKPGLELDPRTGTGTLTTKPSTGEADPEAALRDMGYNPDEYTSTPTKIKRWQATAAGGAGEWLTSATFQIERRTPADLDLPALYQAARRKPRKPSTAQPTERVTVVVLADCQIGKADEHRGGTPELLDRLHQIRHKLETELKRRRPTSTVLIEGGDLVEGFESSGGGAAPYWSNDLSLAQQLDLAAVLVHDWVEAMSRHGRVDVVAVPSNHAAWRQQSTSIGVAARDDLALLMHRQAARVIEAKNIPATWHYPPMHQESASVDVYGTKVGVIHGNQYSPGPKAAIDWWAKQQHGGTTPVSHADVLIGCHYHHFLAIPTGRNAAGRQKWFLQAPTTDNGSTWYATTDGSDSDAGVLVFDITPDGFDLGSLTILTA